MMERYALVRRLQRQRQQVKRMASPQPLIAYVAQHRLLPDTLGLVPEASMTVPEASMTVPERSMAAPEPWHYVSNAETPIDLPMDQTEYRKNDTHIVLSHPRIIDPSHGSKDSLLPTTQFIDKPNNRTNTILPHQQFIDQSNDRTDTILPNTRSITPSHDATDTILPAPQFTTSSYDAVDTIVPDAQSITLSHDATNTILPGTQSITLSHDAADTIRPGTRSIDPPHDGRDPVPPRSPLPTQDGRDPVPLRPRLIDPSPDWTPTEVEQHINQDGRDPVPPRPPFPPTQDGRDPVLPRPRLIDPSPDQQGQTSRRKSRIEERPQPAVSSHAAQEKQATQKTADQSTAEREAAALFTSDTPTRSPQEWFALLTQSERKEASEATTEENASNGNSPSLTNPFSTSSTNKSRIDTNDFSPTPADALPAEPVSLRARRFLKPLLGFDPAGARIHRGPAAARFASKQHADAVTVGDDIFLGAGHANDEPETLGLLAHELTHVARHYDAHFVPAVVDGDRNTRTAVQITATATHQGTTIAGTAPASTNEEALAAQVEHHAREEATQQAHASASPLQTSTPPAMQTQTAQPHPTIQASWGGLPAPWEPLPAWLVSSPSVPTNDPGMVAALPESGSPLPFHTSGNTSGSHSVAPGSASMSMSTGQNAPAPIQRAGSERSQTPARGQDPQQEAPIMPQREPEPDLDKLARQVYAVLKRRLDVERRRMR